MITDRTGKRAILRRTGRVALFFMYCCLGAALLMASITVGGETVEATLPDSTAVLEEAVKVAPKDGLAWVRLGHAYLDIGDAKRARKAFRRALKGSTRAEAYNGLGLLYARQDRVPRQKAFEQFRKAIAARPDYVDAWMNIAELHVKLGDPDAEDAYRDVMRVAPEHAPAYLRLAQWYGDSGYEDRSISLYLHYLQLRPDNADGYYGLALTHVEDGQIGLALATVEQAMRAHPEDIRFLPLAAQAYNARGEASEALGVFSRYLDLIPADERRLYEDVSVISAPAELKALVASAGEGRERLPTDFWRKRDPTLVADGEGRQAEHYRRVWYARTYFAKKVTPWDRRGEVYIRYGEPDYRSRSGRVSPLPSLAVEAVKERLAAQIYTDEWRESFPVPPEVEGSGTLVGPIYPVDRFTNYGQMGASGSFGTLTGRSISPKVAGPTMVAWESWVYVGIAGGVEFAFTDQVGNGRWDFAPPPKIQPWAPLRVAASVARFNPGAVLARIVPRIPDFYSLPAGVDPLEFYYDCASFRGSAGATQVEVYLGVPLRQISSREVQGTRICEVEWRLALVDTAGEPIHRGVERLAFAVEDEEASAGSFVPDVASARIPPGDYRLAIQMTDRTSGKWGIYHQEVIVPGYGDDLAMSDLELSWSVAPEGHGDKFRKRGLWVIPMPSRSFRTGQPPHVYYEIYNLREDEFGRTRYRISYTIKQDIQRRSGLYGALASAFHHLLPGEGRKVKVSYDRSGTEGSEQMFIALDTASLETGLHQVAVAVTDLVTGTSVEKKAMFLLE